MKLILFIVLTLLPQLALSQIYKCNNAKGKITYSETLCPSGSQGSEVYLESNVIDSSALRKRIARGREIGSTSYPSTTTSNSESTDTFMSDHDKKNRLWGLKIDMDDDKATYEKKADAKNEYEILSSNQVHSLLYANELKRRNLKIDLQSFDNLKRSNALQLLSALYMKYKSP